MTQTTQETRTADFMIFAQLDEEVTVVIERSGQETPHEAQIAAEEFMGASNYYGASDR